jgi:hypothetical protein
VIVIYIEGRVMNRVIYFIVISFTVFLAIVVYAAQDKVVTGVHSDFTCVECHEEDVPTGNAPSSVCNACHGDYSEVAGLTEQVEPNPHDSHQGELKCTACHKAHRESVLFCNSCHFYEMTVNQL